MHKIDPSYSYPNRHLRIISGYILTVSFCFILLSSLSAFPHTATRSLRLRVSASPRLRLRVPASPRLRISVSHPEHLWFEAENMRGFATDKRGEPILNAAWLNLPKTKAPGWGINGPGVSAEWSQGGESEWNSAAASADESSAKIYQDLEIPRADSYRLWVRYADWASRSESFAIRITI